MYDQFAFIYYFKQHDIFILILIIKIISDIG